MPVIGFLSSRSPGESNGVVAAFRQGLGEAGFVEGQKVVVAFRWAEGRYDRLPALAADLVDQRVAAILAAGGSPSALAAKAATSTIPIVFTAVPEPIQLGLVASFNRPGGNVTGMSVFSSEMWAKSVELLKELVPAATRMDVQIGGDARGRKPDRLQVHAVEQGHKRAQHDDANLERADRPRVDQFGDVERRPRRHVALPLGCLSATIAYFACWASGDRRFLRCRLCDGN
jgi:putative tryptophan/tyrosine transport system substrate-binding protein